jgi:hypothetical protein
MFVNKEGGAKVDGNIALENEKLKLEVDGRGIIVTLKNKVTGNDYIKALPGGGWKLIFCDGDCLENPVYADRQQGMTELLSDNLLKVEYPSITADKGRLDISLCYTIELQNDEALFTFDLFNGEDVEITEVWFPWIKGIIALGNNPADDALLLPEACGRRLNNPLCGIRDYHSEYLGPDENGTAYSIIYPGEASMQWLSLSNNREGLYMASYDDSFQNTCISAIVHPESELNLSLAFTKYPFIKKGESWKSAQFVLSLLSDSWHAGARKYRAWAEKTWWKCPQPLDWVRDMSGWQRTFLKHQYGEELHRYSDIPEIHQAACSGDIDALMLLGWWSGGFDNRYPEYEIEPAAAAELRSYIDGVHEQGGKVILYTNGRLIDIATDFYRRIGHRISLKDIDGNEYREHYKFWGAGTLLKAFGYKSFAIACPEAAEWLQVLKEQGEQCIALGSDAVFYDQLGGAVFPYPCFDDSHRHSNPNAVAGPGGAAILKELSAYFKDKYPHIALGVELVTDVFGQYADFIHGCGRSFFYEPMAFPEMFRYTFPEYIMSNRGWRDEMQYIKHANYAFINGFRFDVEIYRCRATLKEMPDYSAYLTKLNAVRRRYADTLLHGRFTDKDGLDLSCIAADKVAVRTYRNAGKMALIAWNRSDCPVRMDWLERIAPGFGIKEIMVIDHSACEKADININNMDLNADQMVVCIYDEQR